MVLAGTLGHALFNNRPMQQRHTCGHPSEDANVTCRAALRHRYLRPAAPVPATMCSGVKPAVPVCVARLVSDTQTANTNSTAATKHARHRPGTEGARMNNNDGQLTAACLSASKGYVAVHAAAPATSPANSFCCVLRSPAPAAKQCSTASVSLASEIGAQGWPAQQRQGNACEQLSAQAHHLDRRCYIH